MIKTTANRFIAVRLCLCIVIFLLSCSPVNRLEGYLHLRLNSNPTTLDPAFIVDVTGGSIAAKLFNGLVRLDEDMGIAPDIAERWEIREKGTVYIFHLRRGVFFSHGREVVSSDFKLSFKRILNPARRSPNTWVLENISGAKTYMSGRAEDITGIETPDRYTLKIRLERPFSPFLNLLTMTASYVVPSEIFSKPEHDFSSQPIGTGPFVLESWRQNTELLLKKNNSYFSVKPKISGIAYRVIPEDLTALTEFELGNIDVISIPASEYSGYVSSPKWSRQMVPGNVLNTYYLGFNCSRPPFDDRDLRKAVAYSIDRKKVLSSYYENRGAIAKGPVPDILRKWELSVPYQYDPELASLMLENKAVKKMIINFFITNDQETADISEIIQSYMKQSGFDVRIRQLEWSAYKSALNKGEADMFWISWWADYPDPENFLFPLFYSANHGAGGNRTRYTNMQVDRLIESGKKELLPEKRNYYYMAAERIIIEDLPLLPFWHKKEFALKQPHVKNYKIYPVYTMDKGTEVSL